MAQRRNQASHAGPEGNGSWKHCTIRSAWVRCDAIACAAAERRHQHGLLLCDTIQLGNHFVKI